MTSHEESPYFTLITSNGSRWAGEPPATVEELLEVLKHQPVEHWTSSSAPRSSPEVKTFFGNFQDVSHVFNITSNDPQVVRALSRAIRANRRRFNVYSRRQRRRRAS